MLAARVWLVSLLEVEVGSVCARGRLVQLSRFFEMVFVECVSLLGDVGVLLLLSPFLVLFLSPSFLCCFSLSLSLSCSFFLPLSL